MTLSQRISHHLNKIIIGDEVRNRIIRNIAKIRGVDKILSISFDVGIIFFVRPNIGGVDLLKIKTVCSRNKIPFEIIK